MFGSFARQRHRREQFEKWSRNLEESGYLIEMVLSGQWFGNGRRSSATAINALIGLIMFGYPGFMYALFGRFTWRAESELEVDADEWSDTEEIDTKSGV